MSLINYPKFKEKWQKLYELRCKVAHNSPVTKADYEEIKTMTAELKEKLEKAILSIHKINVPEEEKSELSQSAFSSFQTVYTKPIEASDTLKRSTWGSEYIPNTGIVFPTGITESAMNDLTFGMAVHIPFLHLICVNLFQDKTVLNSIRPCPASAQDQERDTARENAY